ncbi:MAG: FAD-dependent thymidylate synthase, partial [Campylobacterales bacterium]
AGHHTTLMHSHLVIQIEGISRHLIWRLLHAHPYYNSEQVSQRYARMKKENFIYPATADRKRWETYYADCFMAYEELTQALTPIMEVKLPKFKKGIASKKAQEMARYLLPQGMGSYLYHTVNVVTALRYLAAIPSIPEAGSEALFFGSLLEKALLEIDPDLEPLIWEAKEQEFSFPEFDLSKYRGEGVVRVFDVVGEAPAITKEDAKVLRGRMMWHDEGVLGGFSAWMKLSLAADAQNQRHRRSLAIRPALETLYRREAYIPPIIIEARLEERYEAMIERAYDFFEQEVRQIGFGEAVYALPNAHMIEIVERNDWISFAHKAQMRLCYNAQQEIYDLVYEELRQLREIGCGAIEEYLAPCHLRARFGHHPICPEGERFCGVKVWKLSFEAMARKI